MGFAKRRAGIFHNFAMMKRSTRFLPPDKRRDLQQLVALIREQIKQVEMVILFGSYAKNSYVDYDQRIEFGTPTYYMSDYDIAIVTRKPIGAVGVFVVRKDQGSLLREQEPTVPHPSAVRQLRYRRLQPYPVESPLLRDGDQARRNNSLRFGNV